VNIRETVDAIKLHPSFRKANEFELYNLLTTIPSPVAKRRMQDLAHHLSQEAVMQTPLSMAYLREMLHPKKKRNEVRGGGK